MHNFVASVWCILLLRLNITLRRLFKEHKLHIKVKPIILKMSNRTQLDVNSQVNINLPIEKELDI